MTRQQTFAIVLGLSAVNGMFSPYLDLMLALAPLWVPNWMPGSPGLLFYAASMLVATTTLLASGIPVALAERTLPHLRGSTQAMAIWAVSAFALTVPGLVRLFYLVAA